MCTNRKLFCAFLCVFFSSSFASLSVFFKEFSVTAAPWGGWGALGNRIHCYVLADVYNVWFLFAALSVHKSDITREGLLQKKKRRDRKN